MNHIVLMGRPTRDPELRHTQTQEKFEALHGHEKFMKEFGKNYL